VNNACNGDLWCTVLGSQLAGVNRINSFGGKQNSKVRAQGTSTKSKRIGIVSEKEEKSSKNRSTLNKDLNTDSDGYCGQDLKWSKETKNRCQEKYNQQHHKTYRARQDRDILSILRKIQDAQREEFSPLKGLFRKMNYDDKNDNKPEK